ncbi:MAG: OsmC family protein [Verrucomicrobiales bacterium]|nr:OsmC family protein [Verrucomicrobiales bacterium]
MVEVSVTYTGDLHTTAVHGPSGAKLETDAPVDNCGKGEEFSPTDLVGTAMATCMLTIMGIFAQKKGIEIEGATAVVQKEMTAQLPRMIARLSTVIEVPVPEDHPDKQGLIDAAMGCPVHRSLHPDVEKPVDFRWVG